MRGYGVHVRPSEWAKLLSAGKQRALREQSEAGGLERAEGAAGEEVADDQVSATPMKAERRTSPPSSLNPVSLSPLLSAAHSVRRVKERLSHS